MTNSMKVNLAADFQRSVKFFGTQSGQNDFLHDLHRQPLFMDSTYFITSISWKPFEELKPKDYYLEILDNIEAEKKILYKKGRKKFSKEFLKAAATDISFYHIAHFSKLLAAEHKKQLAGQPSDFSTKWAHYWKKIFGIVPLNSSDNFVTDYYSLAVDSYVGDYRLVYLNDAMYPDPDTEIGEQYLEYDRLLLQEMKGVSLEYSVASIFTQRVLLGNKEPILLDLFQKFKNDFPESEYLPAFENAIAPLEEGMEEEKICFSRRSSSIGRSG